MTPELRKDPVTGRWVIIAGERGQRPNPFRRYAPATDAGGECPFCPGHEAMTPPEGVVYRDRPGDGENARSWSVRGGPHRHPALRHEGTPGQRPRGAVDINR